MSNADSVASVSDLEYEKFEAIARMDRDEDHPSVRGTREIELDLESKKLVLRR